MTAISRVSTLSAQTRAIDNFNRVQTRLADLQDQLSSGLKSKTFAGYDGQVQQIVGLNKEVNRLQMFIENNSETVSRLVTQEKSLESMQEIGDDMKSVLTLRNNPSFANNMQFELQMQNLLQSFARELNVNIEGRYLFAGTKTDIQPVITDPIPQPVVIGEPDDGYYQGSKENVIARIQDNIEIEYEVRADNEAFQKVFSAVAQSIQAHENNDQDGLAAAQNTLDEAIAGINALTARVRSQYVDIENINTRNEDMRLYYSGVAEQLVKADPVDVATRVAVDEATLNATFQVFSRISRLNLTDFL